MAIFKFDDNDVFINTLVAYPEYSFYMADGVVYIDNRPNISGSHRHPNEDVDHRYEGGNIFHVKDSFVSLYEYNVNRGSGSITISNPDITKTNLIDSQYWLETTRASETDATGSLIRPFVVSDGERVSIRSYKDHEANIEFDYGDLIPGDYNISASLTASHYASNDSTTSMKTRIVAGKKKFYLSGDSETGDDDFVQFSISNTLSKYSFRSPHMKMVTEEPLVERNLKTCEMAFIGVPSLFYGKKIKPGTVELNYYITGSLVGTLKDRGRNGELIQTFLTSSHDTTRPNTSGSVQGIVLYSEGIIILTGSYQLGDDNQINYRSAGTSINKWTHFASDLDHLRFGLDGAQVYARHATSLSASYELKYQGVSEIPTLMMMAHAKYGELNWSNNPTYLDQTSKNLGQYKVSSSVLYEEFEVSIANTTDTTLTSYTPVEQKKETYITKVAIYDEKRNLIGVASLANPVRKTEDRQYTFKLKIDL